MSRALVHTVIAALLSTGCVETSSRVVSEPSVREHGRSQILTTPSFVRVRLATLPGGRVLVRAERAETCWEETRTIVPQSVETTARPGAWGIIGVGGAGVGTYIAARAGDSNLAAAGLLTTFASVALTVGLVVDATGKKPLQPRTDTQVAHLPCGGLPLRGARITLVGAEGAVVGVTADDGTLVVDGRGLRPTALVDGLPARVEWEEP